MRIPFEIIQQEIDNNDSNIFSIIIPEEFRNRTTETISIPKYQMKNEIINNIDMSIQDNLLIESDNNKKILKDYNLKHKEEEKNISINNNKYSFSYIYEKIKSKKFIIIFSVGVVLLLISIFIIILIIIK